VTGSPGFHATDDCGAPHSKKPKYSGRNEKTLVSKGGTGLYLCNLPHFSGRNPSACGVETAAGKGEAALMARAVEKILTLEGRTGGRGNEAF